MAGRYAANELADRTAPVKMGRHTDVKPSGRRRAVEELPMRDPRNTGPLHRVGKKRVSGVSIGLLTTGAVSVASGAIAASPNPEPMTEIIQVVEPTQEPITADSTVIVAQPKVLVETEAAPPPPVEVTPIPKVEYIPAPEPAPAQPTPVVIVPPQPVAPPVSAGAGARQAILNAAYAQIGVYQDCTMLVTNSLRAVGINFHDWPIGYFTLGYQVSRLDALPGDLVYYANGGGGWAHIAVYAGNGRAVHGGFNGNETREFSVDVGSGPVFIRVT